MVFCSYLQVGQSSPRCGESALHALAYPIDALQARAGHMRKGIFNVVNDGVHHQCARGQMDCKISQDFARQVHWVLGSCSVDATFRNVPCTSSFKTAMRPCTLDSRDPQWRLAGTLRGCHQASCPRGWCKQMAPVRPASGGVCTHKEQRLQGQGGVPCATLLLNPGTGGLLPMVQ